MAEEKKKKVEQEQKKKLSFPKLRKEKKQKEEKEELVHVGDPYDILKFVLMTEKSVRQVEAQNKLVFVVDRKAKKNEIKSAAQSAFNSPVSGVKTLIDQRGRKRAFIKFKQAGAASDIAIRLGII